MKPFPLRPVFGWALAFCLALALGCTKSEPSAKPPVLSAEQVRQLQQRVAGIQTQVAQLEGRVADLRRENALALQAITSDTQTALAELSLVNQQLGGKTVPPPAAKTAAKTAPPEKGPLGPLMRLLLIVVAIVAVIVIVKIFLGRLGEDEEDDEDDLGGDEEAAAEEAPGPAAVELPRPPELVPPVPAGARKPER